MMALKVSSWNKTCDTEYIPSCQANDIWSVIINKKKYKKLVYDDEIDLGLCWEYFNRTCKCYCLEPKYDRTREDYIYNLNKFQFSFRALDSSAEGNGIYTMKKYKEFYLGCNKLDYGTREYYIYDLNKFQFLFGELDSSVEENKMFTMKKYKECSCGCNKLDYVSDIHGLLC